MLVRLNCAAWAISLSLFNLSLSVGADHLTENLASAPEREEFGQTSKPEVVFESSISEEVGRIHIPLLQQCSAESCGECSSCADCAPLCAPCSLACPREPGLIFGADLLVWRANVRNPGLSDVQNGVVPIPPGPGPFPDVVDNQQIDAFRLPWDTGFRGQIGYRFQSGWEALFRYTNYESEEQQVIFGLGVLAGAIDVKQTTYDLEAGRWFSISPHHDVRLFGGLRWGSLDTDYRRGIQGFAFNISRYQTDMDGLGLRLGGETHWKFGYGFSGFVRGAGAILVSEFDNTSFRFEDLGPLNSIRIRRESTRQGVPIVDLAAGINYRWKKVEVQAGYELSHWFNAVPLQAAENLGSIDVTFDGLFVRAGWNY